METLVKRQHVFPSMSIKRFENDKGFVQLNNLIAKKIHPANSNNDLFCKYRIWDQRSEAGYGKFIEGIVDMESLWMTLWIW